MHQLILDPFADLHALIGASFFSYRSRRMMVLNPSEIKNKSGTIFITGDYAAFACGGVFRIVALLEDKVLPARAILEYSEPPNHLQIADSAPAGTLTFMTPADVHTEISQCLEIIKEAALK